MINIRRNVFETNSSSSHSITIVPTSKFDDWVNNRNHCYFSTIYEDLVCLTDKKDSQTQKLYKDAAEIWRVDGREGTFQEQSEDTQLDYILDIYNLLTYQQWRYEWFEGFDYTTVNYVTKHGDHITAFGKGGYDG